MRLWRKVTQEGYTCRYVYHINTTCRNERKKNKVISKGDPPTGDIMGGGTSFNTFSWSKVVELFCFQHFQLPAAKCPYCRSSISTNTPFTPQPAHFTWKSSLYPLNVLLLLPSTNFTPSPLLSHWHRSHDTVPLTLSLTPKSRQASTKDVTFWSRLNRTEASLGRQNTLWTQHWRIYEMDEFEKH